MLFAFLQIKQMLKDDPLMKEMFDHVLGDTGAIKLRDAFFGGRVEVQKLFAQSDDEYEISYFDINSLYPS